MDILAELLSAGFTRTIVLSGSECGIEAMTLLLALYPYEAETVPANTGAWIHPYYFASQRAYMAASALVRRAKAQGIPMKLRDDIRVKPIFARLPGFTQGWNTLTYAEKYGSRFHVQIMTLDALLPVTDHLSSAPHGLHCGNCRRCMDACPTHALDENGFHREKCIRNWMLGSQSVPEVMRAAMGNRLIGCDECQRCCPHNPAPAGEPHAAVDLLQLLTQPSGGAALLKPLIGANLAIRNRMLAQACLIAGNSEDAAYLPALVMLTEHPSPLVKDAAVWAAKQLERLE